MNAIGSPSVVHNVLVIDRDHATRAQVVEAFGRHDEFRIVGDVRSIARGCVLARRADVDLVVIGRVGAGAAVVDPLALLQRLAPYARLVVFAPDPPRAVVELDDVLDLSSDEGAGRDADDLVRAVLEFIGIAPADIDLRPDPAEATGPAQGHRPRS